MSNDYEWNPEDDQASHRGTATWRESDAGMMLDDTTSHIAEQHDANPHLFTIWSHLNALGNYAPLVRNEQGRREVIRHANEGLQRVNSASYKVKKEFINNLAGNAVQSLGMATNVLVKHLGPDHPIAQEALANHAGAISAHSALLEGK